MCVSCLWPTACRLMPGKWLGPWALARAVQAAASSAPPGSLSGLGVHVVCDAGGGAPALNVDGLLSMLLQPEAVGAQPAAGDASSACLHEQPAAEQHGAGGGDAAADVRLQQPPAAEGPGPAGSRSGGSGGSSSTACAPAAQPARYSALLLLLPLTLGVERINPAYLPQLQELLTWPLSVGIVGGRPGASLFFVGRQDSNVLYLDPHTVQRAAKLPEDVGTYFCDEPRLMPIHLIDPSLAIGFYCRSAQDVQALAAQLEELSAQHSAAPLLTITRGPAIASARSDDLLPMEDDDDTMMMGMAPGRSLAEAGPSKSAGAGGSGAADDSGWEML